MRQYPTTPGGPHRHHKISHRLVTRIRDEVAYPPAQQIPHITRHHRPSHTIRRQLRRPLAHQTISRYADASPTASCSAPGWNRRLMHLQTNIPRLQHSRKVPARRGAPAIDPAFAGVGLYTPDSIPRQARQAGTLSLQTLRHPKPTRPIKPVAKTANSRRSITQKTLHQNNTPRQAAGAHVSSKERGSTTPQSVAMPAILLFAVR